MPEFCYCKEFCHETMNFDSRIFWIKTIPIKMKFFVAGSKVIGLKKQQNKQT